MYKKNYIILFFTGIFAILAAASHAQTEVMAWGNMTGIRIDGQLIEFESSFRVVESNWTAMDFTGRERQTTRFTRTGNVTTVNSAVKRVTFEQKVEDQSKGVATVNLSFQSDTTHKVEGVYYCFALPDKRYGTGTVKIGNTSVSIAGLNKDNKQLRKLSGKQIVVVTEEREIKMNFSSGISAFVRKETDHAVLYVQLMNGNLKKGQKGNLAVTLTTSGTIDTQPVEIAISKNDPGRLFVGLGGNFRLQNPTTDPQVIDYCLNNLRVAWGRVEMPWGTWDPAEDGTALANARKGELNPRIHQAMEMAQRLAAKGMPVIVSAWFPPQWALAEGQRRGMGGVAGLKLNQHKMQRIYQSIADYLVCLKELYGVEAYSFSFNESDIGIDVLHTAQEHADFIKGFGAYMASRGLSTKVLLGDNSDATTFDFIVPALNDPAVHKYISAISFHSWRGCDDATLKKWAEAARQLNVPLIIGEGSTDAAAWRYPEIFLESTFALYEINLYIRICSLSQPLTILQWQYTADYSLLWGGGIFRVEGPLRPTQRFWNLQQLSDTPEQAFALPFTCNKEEVNCAAFGNLTRNEYAVHIVNNGAQRQATIKGLPDNLSDFNVYATNNVLSKQALKATKAADGTISIDLPPISFVTLIARLRDNDTPATITKVGSINANIQMNR